MRALRVPQQVVVMQLPAHVLQARTHYVLPVMVETEMALLATCVLLAARTRWLTTEWRVWPVLQMLSPALVQLLLLVLVTQVTPAQMVWCVQLVWMANTSPKLRMLLVRMLLLDLMVLVVLPVLVLLVSQRALPELITTLTD